MYQLLVIVSFLGLFFVNDVESQYSSVPSQDVVTNFKPSLALVVGILAIMLSLTLIILLYAKYCHRPSSPSFPDQQGAREGVFRRAPGTQFSGIDKKVIESLPFFKFSALGGAKEGLECAVCLSRFEEMEILRLLPKCRHAFHVSCIDEWLGMHASCPLCRVRVRISAVDPEIFAYSNSLRFLWWNNQSESMQQDHDQDSNLGLYVERQDERVESTSFRRIEKSKNDEELLLKKLRNFDHKIIMSDVVFKNRWSNVSSSDLIILNSEMISDMSSDRFSKIETGGVMGMKQELDKKRLYEYKINNNVASSSDTKTSKIQSEKRSVSEIIGVSRFDYLDKKKRLLKSCLNENNNNTKDERMRQLWLPIARRTAQWFANREKRESLDV